MKSSGLVVVRGGGDIATGIIHRLYRSGFKVAALETAQPTVIRRTVAVAQCVFCGETEVEGLKARLAASPEEALEMAGKGLVPVLVDPEARFLEALRPAVVVDAILAKKNMGTSLDMAPIVVGVGPGFTARRDVHAVVETQRGHYLGKVYYEGSAIPDTGIPGKIEGVDKERVVRSPADGLFFPAREIGERVKRGETLGSVNGVEVKSPLEGILRGLINKGVEVKKGMKIGDVDPRQVREHCFSISDKARAVGGGVLEAILHFSREDAK
ncbi:MAG: selenium-dependent molybdenum cofactor biosynthesis protein YqeB [Peptococcaceae bacterium]|nr:selenium-dependent molybdenum cofactor biosynthesis protein YqeB [Peptococcaceae bacterium]MDH7524600.1 selenium-dependent molybdenum cofactor biosynthesis protein YqeB [Peptococcaceae bacterium]